MKIQNIHKNTIRHRKNNGWLQGSGQSEKPENDTKIKILNISINSHKPILPPGLEQLFKVTPCNEKCNFFNLLNRIPLLRILLIGIIPLCRDGTSLLVQLQNLLFCRLGFRSPILHFFCGRGFRSPILYFLYRKGFRSLILTFLTKTNMSNQWKRKIEKDTKIVTVTNSCYIKKVALNTV